MSTGEHAKLVVAVVEEAQALGLVDPGELVSVNGTGAIRKECIRVPRGCDLAGFSLEQMDLGVAEQCKIAVSQSAVLGWILARIGLEPNAVSVAAVSARLPRPWPRMSRSDP